MAKSVVLDNETYWFSIFRESMHYGASRQDFEAGSNLFTNLMQFCVLRSSCQRRLA
jgi:hypothetical protein